MATPLSEKATKQFSHDDNVSTIPDSPIEHIHFDFLRVPEVVSDKSRPTFRRSLSMYDNATPNARVRRFSIEWNAALTNTIFLCEMHNSES